MMMIVKFSCRHYIVLVVVVASFCFLPRLDFWFVTTTATTNSSTIILKSKYENSYTSWFSSIFPSILVNNFILSNNRNNVIRIDPSQSKFRQQELPHFDDDNLQQKYDTEINDAIRILQTRGMIICKRNDKVSDMLVARYNEYPVLDETIFPDSLPLKEIFCFSSVDTLTLQSFKVVEFNKDKVVSYRSNNLYHSRTYSASDTTSKLRTQSNVRRLQTETASLDTASRNETHFDSDDRNHNHHDEIKSWYDVLFYSIGALVCVIVAALAAGLTLGMLGLDPLMLLIKERAAIDMNERLMAKRLLPIIKQRHLLLVTLLLMNSISNETMPIFLEKLFPPAIAIAISVTLVLFFGEIIPSAIFTGPNQLRIAASMVPIVKIVMCLLYPLAGPIAKLLDYILGVNHDDNGTNNSLDNNKSTRNLNDNNNNNDNSKHNNNGGHHDEFNLYDRNELAALVRIQYEERLAMKRRITHERRTIHESYRGTSSSLSMPQLIHHASEIFTHDHDTPVPVSRQRSISIKFDALSSPSSPTVQISTVNALDNSVTTKNLQTLAMPLCSAEIDSRIPSISTEVSSSKPLPDDDNKNFVAGQNYPPGTTSLNTTTTSNHSAHVNNHDWSKMYQRISDSIENNRNTIRDSIIELDEVMMVEGALQMKTKCAFDVFTPIRNVFALPASMVLTERAMVQIYASGYSRIPVYDDSKEVISNKKRRYPQSAIIGILVTKVLIVVDPKDHRTVGSLPLRTPQCVSPATPLIDLINMFQTGGAKGGHQALVCAIPSVGNKAFQEGYGQCCLPEKAGLIGIVTFEDVLEMLLQEQIYDEMDHEQRTGQRLAELVWRRWKVYTVKRRDEKQQKSATATGNNKNRIQLFTKNKKDNTKKHNIVNEKTSLL